MPKYFQSLSLLLFFLLFSFTADAQRKPIRTISTQSAKDAAQRQADEASVAKMQDFGYDAAVVVSPSVIRETANAAGKVILTVKRGVFLSLVDRQPTDNWYKVVQAESGDEGWIDGRSVVIKLTVNTETGPPLEEEEAAANAVPQVTISNLEERTTLRIRLNGKLFLIEPQTSKTVAVPAGKFAYYGWSPGIRPATGHSVLEKGKKYNWKFRIYKR